MLQVIGAGFGRTGTMSLKAALEQLGFNPCYHMVEVFSHPDHIALWRAIGEGQPADWEGLFRGYQAAVDLPASEFYEQLMQAYPEAKVVLTVRDPAQWYESASSTIFRVGRDERPFDPPPGFMEMVGAIMRRFCPEGVDDRAAAIAAFERHNRQVQERVPPERLLVYEVRDGWEPLCRFLGVDVPGASFPRLNDRQEFQNRTRIPGAGPGPHPG
ncbi:MAG TPA: sulfotransferase [Chloroflexota bacterium]|nr:sulfotransferase [Chloroflexota bacterium]